MTTITWHPIDPATIPRGRRIMLWNSTVDEYLGQIALGVIEPDGSDWVDVGVLDFRLNCFSHWAECPDGPNGETP